MFHIQVTDCAAWVNLFVPSTDWTTVDFQRDVSLHHLFNDAFQQVLRFVFSRQVSLRKVDMCDGVKTAELNSFQHCLIVTIIDLLYGVVRLKPFLIDPVSSEVFKVMYAHQNKIKIATYHGLKLFPVQMRFAELYAFKHRQLCTVFLSRSFNVVRVFVKGKVPVPLVFRIHVKMFGEADGVELLFGGSPTHLINRGIPINRML